MIKTIRFCLPLLFVLVLVAGCKKPDFEPCDNEPNYIPLNTALVPYIFADSSQWIYDRSIDSLTDTVTLRSAARTVYAWSSRGGTANMTGGCSSYFEEERFSLFYFSSIDGGYWQNTRSDEIWLTGNPPGLAFWGGQVGQSRRGVEIEAIHNSLRVGANSFSNVIQVHTNVGATGEAGIYRFYYCPNIGIVRKEVMYGDSVHNTYDLVEWHVQPYR